MMAVLKAVLHVSHELMNDCIIRWIMARARDENGRTVVDGSPCSDLA